MTAVRKPSGVPIKITTVDHAKLQVWAREDERPMAAIVNDLIERYERDRFWKGVHEDYERLRADPVAWQDYQDEVALFEGGSMDGLENGEPYYSPEEEEEIRGVARTQGG
jgi:hypothetical protein